MKKIILPIAALTMMSTLAFAGGDIDEAEVIPEVSAGGFYAGLGLVAASVRDPDVSVDLWHTGPAQERMGALSFIAGYNFNAYIAVEGRYNNSFTHDDQIEMSGWSLFVKPQYPVSENFSVYALLGYGGLDLSGSLVSAEPSIPVVDVDDGTFQWGIGMSYSVTENISLFADYAWLADSIDDVNNIHQLSVDAFTIGVNYQF